jgi:NCS1 family nucleobase:cation symporter-1
MASIANQIESNSINFIDQSERRGTARSLFWPWAAANVSFLALSYGSFFLGFGISFWQATAAAVIGTLGSFSLVAISSLAGKRANAPTMTLSRAAFGVKGNRLPGFLSYLIFVGWETVLVSLATLASETVFTRVGNIDPDLSKIFGLLLAGGLTIIGGVLGFKVIMKIQFFLTITTVALTAGYILLTIDAVNWTKVSTIENGTTAGFIGAVTFAITGIGLGWVGCAADYSRYLPRTVSGRAVFGWTIFGASIVPIALVIYGSLLAASSDELNQQVAADPIGALTTLLPTWYLIPFAFVAILGLIGGATLDLYSSGLVLVSIGLPVKRYVAASIDGVIMTIGTIYLVWFASDFFVPFQGFLITLGVPVAVWSGLFVADVLLRKSYAEKELFDANGRYGAYNFKSIGLITFGTIIGWGLVTNSLASWLSWQGYLLSPIGGKDGQWAYANLGVIAALLIGFAGHIALSSRSINAQNKSIRSRI